MDPFGDDISIGSSSFRRDVAAPQDEPVRDIPTECTRSLTKKELTKKELKKLAIEAPGSLEVEQSNLEKLRFAFETFGETTKAYHDELRNIKVRLKEGKEMYEQTEELLKQFNTDEMKVNFQALTKRNPADLLSRINPGNLDEQLKEMEKRILVAKTCLANDENHSELKKSIEKYHDIFKRSLDNFDQTTCDPCKKIEKESKPRSIYTTKRLLEEASAIIPEEEERDSQAAVTIDMMKKLAASMSQTKMEDLTSVRSDLDLQPSKASKKQE